MNIYLLSDLHLSVHPFDPPQTDADLVVIAGDLGRPEQAMAWARQLGKTTVFVAGNHEFYGCDLTTTFERLHAAAQGSLVQILERRTWAHQGVRFPGCTLWSDHRLFEGEARAQARQRAQSMIADFSRIAKTRGGATLIPDDARAELDHAVAWLDTQFALSWDGPTVVVTHFAPSRRSIHPRFADSLLNACFVSDQYQSSTPICVRDLPGLETSIKSFFESLSRQRSKQASSAGRMQPSAPRGMIPSPSRRR